MNTDIFAKPLAGQRALVTGAARGLGHAIAVALANAGADIIAGVRDNSTCEALRHALNEAGSDFTIVEMDVLDLSACEQTIDALVADGGPIDVLVNNVGGGIEAPAIDIKREDFDHVIALNLTHPLVLSLRVAKHLIATGKPGAIVNLSSQAAHVALPGETSYCVAKAGLSHLTRCLAIEWGRYGIRVNAVSPTFIETPGTEAARSDPDNLADIKERIAALKRIGRPREVADAVVYLASSGASLITGHDLVIDGGWTIR